MYKTTLTINGMACSMCENHINETVRKAVPGVRKVTSSHKKNRTEILSDEIPDEVTLRAALAATGYDMTAYHTESYARKGFSLFGR